ncbi:putative flavin-containing monooxygenase [Rhodococcus opacus]|uniref:Putative flavin-containing monooxygenase n=1 Tax=Rhodococcus opacus TaxID=37919 RepID=A0A1B1K881_RHOOP|nr:NAD(P)/FAD-dependent oxidoreductase [Rhodococcus opacus]ANS28834.1 putative flavin-containing monooxygenase [Rhodococcus opacus]
MTRASSTAAGPVPLETDARDPYDHYLPIDESDTFLEQVVQEAELPALLAALALANGDLSLLVDEVKPPLPPMDSVIAPQGGMTQEAQQQARSLAATALKLLRDHGSVPAVEPTEDFLAHIMRFLTKDAGDEYLPLLRHELGIPTDYGTPKWTKPTLAPDVEFAVAIIGAGISGMAAAHRLQQAGVDYVVFEKNTEVGGTWWENVYPGCRLDTPNFAYSYSFAQKADWPQQFSTQQEIESYLQSVATSFDLRPNIEFDTEVTSAQFDDDSATWTLVTRTGQGESRTHRVNAVITAVGQLNRPNIPDIPGLATFDGRWFHSAQWDTELDVTGLKVAVVGTGASAYQIVPAIAGKVQHLSVFQRNAPWMLPTPTYLDDIPAGMQWLLRHVPHYGRWYRFWQFWIAAEGRLQFVEADSTWTDENSTSANNAKLRTQLLAHLHSQLADAPELLEKMTPTYPPGAKRLLRDNGVWAATIKQPHVDLVTDGIEEITPTGIRTADGRLHEVDVIIFATGFRASDYLEPIKITGREGKDLHEYWGGDARAYMGITVPSFPNLFMLMGPNTGVVVNGSSLYMAECAAEYTVECLGELLRAGKRTIELHQDALDAFCERVDAGNRRRTWGVAKVHTWYRNRFGRATQVWPFSLLEFYQLTRRPDLAAFDLKGDIE